MVPNQESISATLSQLALRVRRRRNRNNFFSDWANSFKWNLALIFCNKIFKLLCELHVMFNLLNIYDQAVQKSSGSATRLWATEGHVCNLALTSSVEVDTRISI
jgi:hypothetical protein